MNFKVLLRILGIIVIILITYYQCQKPESDEKAITLLVLSMGSVDYTSTIAENNITFANKVPNGTTEVTIKQIAISLKASSSKQIGDKLNVGVGNLKHKRLE